MVWLFGSVLPAKVTVQKGDWPSKGEDDGREKHTVTVRKLKELHSSDEWKWGSITISACESGWVCPTVVHFKNLDYDTDLGWPVECSVVRRRGSVAKDPEVYLWHYRENGVMPLKIGADRVEIDKHVIFTTREELLVPRASFQGEVTSEDDSMIVAVRIRPFAPYEKQNGSELCVKMGEPDVNGKTPTFLTEAGGKERDFTFDFSFWSHDGFYDDNGITKAVNPGDDDRETKTHYSDQAEVFSKAAFPLLEKALQGINVTMFAYGQTGAGKSYSMAGTLENRGIIPMFCDELFKNLEEMKEETLIQGHIVTVSMVEIYMEKVFDLLKSPRQEGRVVSLEDYFVVKDLTQHDVVNFEQVDGFMNAGMENRSVASTAMNNTSSRAHTIFQLTVKIQKTCSQMWTSSRVNLVDLAGSEVSGKTGAEVGSTTHKEGQLINQSLTTLNLVINQLGDPKMKTNPPAMRNSELTKLLKESLMGNCKTLVLAALSPASFNAKETLSTLRKMKEMKKLQNVVTANEEISKELVASLRKLIDDLKEQLDEERAGEMSSKRGRRGATAAIDGDPVVIEQSVERQEENEEKLGKTTELEDKLAVLVSQLDHAETDAQSFEQQEEDFKARMKGMHEENTKLKWALKVTRGWRQSETQSKKGLEDDVKAAREKRREEQESASELRCKLEILQKHSDNERAEKEELSRQNEDSRLNMQSKFAKQLKVQAETINMRAPTTGLRFTAPHQFALVERRQQKEFDDIKFTKPVARFTVESSVFLEHHDGTVMVQWADETNWNFKFEVGESSQGFKVKMFDKKGLSYVVAAAGFDMKPYLLQRVHLMATFERTNSNVVTLRVFVNGKQKAIEEKEFHKKDPEFSFSGYKKSTEPPPYFIIGHARSGMAYESYPGPPLIGYVWDVRLWIAGMSSNENRFGLGDESESHGQKACQFDENGRLALKLTDAVVKYDLHPYKEDIYDKIQLNGVHWHRNRKLVKDLVSAHVEESDTLEADDMTPFKCQVKLGKKLPTALSLWIPFYECYYGEAVFSSLDHPNQITSSDEKYSKLFTFDLQDSSDKMAGDIVICGARNESPPTFVAAAAGRVFLSEDSGESVDITLRDGGPDAVTFFEHDYNVEWSHERPTNSEKGIRIQSVTHQSVNLHGGLTFTNPARNSQTQHAGPVLERQESDGLSREAALSTVLSGADKADIEHEAEMYFKDLTRAYYPEGPSRLRQSFQRDKMFDKIFLKACNMEDKGETLRFVLTSAPVDVLLDSEVKMKAPVKVACYLFWVARRILDSESAFIALAPKEDYALKVRNEIFAWCLNHPVTRDWAVVLLHHGVDPACTGQINTDIDQESSQSDFNFDKWAAKLQLAELLTQLRNEQLTHCKAFKDVATFVNFDWKILCAVQDVVHRKSRLCDLESIVQDDEDCPQLHDVYCCLIYEIASRPRKGKTGDWSHAEEVACDAVRELKKNAFTLSDFLKLPPSICDNILLNCHCFTVQILDQETATDWWSACGSWKGDSRKKYPQATNAFESPLPTLTAGHIATPIHLAAQNDHHALLKACLEAFNGDDMFSTIFKTHPCPLWLAVDAFAHNAVELLVKQHRFKALSNCFEASFPLAIESVLDGGAGCVGATALSSHRISPLSFHWCNKLCRSLVEKRLFTDAAEDIYFLKLLKTQFGLLDALPRRPDRQPKKTNQIRGQVTSIDDLEVEVFPDRTGSPLLQEVSKNEGKKIANVWITHFSKNENHCFEEKCELRMNSELNDQDEFIISSALRQHDKDWETTNINELRDLLSSADGVSDECLERIQVWVEHGRSLLLTSIAGKTKLPKVHRLCLSKRHKVRCVCLSDQHEPFGVQIVLQDEADGRKVWPIWHHCGLTIRFHSIEDRYLALRHLGGPDVLLPDPSGRLPFKLATAFCPTRADDAFWGAAMLITNWALFTVSHHEDIDKHFNDKMRECETPRNDFWETGSGANDRAPKLPMACLPQLLAIPDRQFRKRILHVLQAGSVNVAAQGALLRSGLLETASLLIKEHRSDMPASEFALSKESAQLCKIDVSVPSMFGIHLEGAEYQQAFTHIGKTFGHAVFDLFASDHLSQDNNGKWSLSCSSEYTRSARVLNASQGILCVMGTVQKDDLDSALRIMWNLIVRSDRVDVVNNRFFPGHSAEDPSANNHIGAKTLIVWPTAASDYQRSSCINQRSRSPQFAADQYMQFALKLFLREMGPMTTFLDALRKESTGGGIKARHSRKLFELLGPLRIESLLIFQETLAKDWAECLPPYDDGVTGKVFHGELFEIIVSSLASFRNDLAPFLANFDAVINDWANDASDCPDSLLDFQSKDSLRAFFSLPGVDKTRNVADMSKQEIRDGLTNIFRGQDLRGKKLASLHLLHCVQLPIGLIVSYELYIKWISTVLGPLCHVTNCRSGRSREVELHGIKQVYEVVPKARPLTLKQLEEASHQIPASSWEAATFLQTQAIAALSDVAAEVKTQRFRHKKATPADCFPVPQQGRIHVDTSQTPATVMHDDFGVLHVEWIKPFNDRSGNAESALMFKIKSHGCDPSIVEVFSSHDKAHSPKGSFLNPWVATAMSLDGAKQNVSIQIVVGDEKTANPPNRQNNNGASNRELSDVSSSLVSNALGTMADTSVESRLRRCNHGTVLMKNGTRFLNPVRSTFGKNSEALGVVPIKLREPVVLGSLLDTLQASRDTRSEWQHFVDRVECDHDYVLQPKEVSEQARWVFNMSQKKYQEDEISGLKTIIEDGLYKNATSGEAKLNAHRARVPLPKIKRLQRGNFLNKIISLEKKTDPAEMSDAEYCKFLIDAEPLYARWLEGDKEALKVVELAESNNNGEYNEYLHREEYAPQNLRQTPFRSLITLPSYRGRLLKLCRTMSPYAVAKHSEVNQSRCSNAGPICSATIAVEKHNASQLLITGIQTSIESGELAHGRYFAPLVRGSIRLVEWHFGMLNIFSRNFLLEALDSDKWATRAAYYLMFAPTALVFLLIILRWLYPNATEWTTTFPVGAHVATICCLVLFAVWRKKDDPSTVQAESAPEHRTLQFYPAHKWHLNIPNFAAIFAMFVEWWIHSAFTFIPWPAEDLRAHNLSAVADATQLAFLQLDGEYFWYRTAVIFFIMCVWLMSLRIAYSFLSGKQRAYTSALKWYKDGDDNHNLDDTSTVGSENLTCCSFRCCACIGSRQLWEKRLRRVFVNTIPGLLTGLLYVSLCSGLLRVADCHFNVSAVSNTTDNSSTHQRQGVAYHDELTSMECYQNEHLLWLWISFMFFDAYFPSSVLAPFQVMFPRENEDARQTQQAVMIGNLVKTLMVTSQVFNSQRPLIFLIACLLGNISLSLYTYRQQPCSIQHFNVIKCVYLSAAAWSNIFGIVMVTQNHEALEELIGLAPIHFVIVGNVGCVVFLVGAVFVGNHKLDAAAFDQLQDLECKISHGSLIKNGIREFMRFKERLVNDHYKVGPRSEEACAILDAVAAVVFEQLKFEGGSGASSTMTKSLDSMAFKVASDASDDFHKFHPLLPLVPTSQHELIDHLIFNLPRVRRILARAAKRRFKPNHTQQNIRHHKTGRDLLRVLLSPVNSTTKLHWTPASELQNEDTGERALWYLRSFLVDHVLTVFSKGDHVFLQRQTNSDTTVLVTCNPSVESRTCSSRCKRIRMLAPNFLPGSVDAEISARFGGKHVLISTDRFKADKVAKELLSQALPQGDSQEQPSQALPQEGWPSDVDISQPRAHHGEGRPSDVDLTYLIENEQEGFLIAEVVNGYCILVKPYSAQPNPVVVAAFPNPVIEYLRDTGVSARNPHVELKTPRTEVFEAKRKDMRDDSRAQHDIGQLGADQN